jgi:hypothetical protein
MSVRPAPNRTWNQHFVPQVEQRLNAADPPSNRRIFSFRCLDRERLIVQLEHAKGAAIEKNLAFRDLFSFDVAGSQRTNLEAAFEQYERDIRLHSERLIVNLRAGNHTDLKADLLGVFVAKLLNMFRNPFSVKKGLNTFGAAADYLPTDVALHAAYDAFMKGNRPQQAAACARFDLTEDGYTRWLKALFILLLPHTPGIPNQLELAVKNLFESHYVEVFVHDYFTSPEADPCLLSDRSFTYDDRSSVLRLDFNLCSHAFVTFVFCSVEAHLPPGVPPEFAAHAASALRGQVVVHSVQGDVEALKAYNTRVVHQCAERVFSARAHIPALSV